MYQSREERQAEIILGEAIMHLIEKDAPISSNAVLLRLRALLPVEEDECRKKGILLAISKIKDSLENAAGKSKESNEMPDSLPAKPTTKH